jgi:signal transduction histidine kinase
MERSQIELAGAKVLLVDDTPANLKLLRQALEPEGYSILIASSGEAALRIVRNARPDLILLDVQMPGLNGFDTCRLLKQDEATRSIPVIFVTARAETESVVEGFRAGGVDYIVKPFQSEEVLARVRTHLQIDRLARDLETSNRALSRANREIREATERKSRFLASMAHELRTPMNAILGFTSLVLRHSGEALPERQRDNLAKVKQCGEHQLRLIAEVLDLSRIEAGRTEIHPAPLSVKRLAMDCCAEVGPLVPAGVTLTCEAPDSLPEIVTDEARLRQILMNLLSNALKFTESGEVRVAVKRPPTDDRRPIAADGRESEASFLRSSVVGPPSGDLLEIAVSDTGIGIPPDALDTIFEEFRQVKRPEPQKHQGTGLGLTITKRLTELLGGTIAVESEAGRGSTFTVRLPCPPCEAQPGSRGAMESRCLSGGGVS